MKTFFKTLADPRMFLLLIMGFVSGLPLPLVGGALKIWLKEYNVDLATIGLFALAGLPYTLKFVWSPVFDKFVPPFLGRRRGWAIVLQAGLILALFGLSSTDPSQSVQMIAVWALVISFLGASQDIVLDAYRWEILKPEEYGLGTSTFVTGYRIALLVGGTLTLILADKVDGAGLAWSTVYQLMSGLMLLGIAATWFAQEPKMYSPPPKNLKESVVDPFIDYLVRPGALIMLLFMMLYKVGDNIAAEMLWPFYKDLGYSLTVIGTVSKFAGFAGTVIGAFIGGALVLRLGLVASLWICGILQSVSTLSFTWLAWFGSAALAATAAVAAGTEGAALMPPPTWALIAVILVENLAGGMGTSAFLGFMGHLTNKKYTATQYALFTSLMGVPRVLMGSSSGYLAKATGWEQFFILCALAAIPGMALLVWMGRWVHDTQTSPGKAANDGENGRPVTAT